MKDTLRTLPRLLTLLRILVTAAVFLPSCRGEDETPPPPPGPGEEGDAASAAAIITPDNAILNGPGANPCRCQCSDAACVCKPAREGGCGCASSATGGECECTCEGGGKKGPYKTHKHPAGPMTISGEPPGDMPSAGGGSK